MKENHKALNVWEATVCGRRGRVYVCRKETGVYLICLLQQCPRNGLRERGCTEDREGIIRSVRSSSMHLAFDYLQTERRAS